MDASGSSLQPMDTSGASRRLPARNPSRSTVLMGPAGLQLVPGLQDPSSTLMILSAADEEDHAVTPIAATRQQAVLQQQAGAAGAGLLMAGAQVPAALAMGSLAQAQHAQQQQAAFATPPGSLLTTQQFAAAPVAALPAQALMAAQMAPQVMAMPTGSATPLATLASSPYLWNPHLLAAMAHQHQAQADFLNAQHQEARLHQAQLQQEEAAHLHMMQAEQTAYMSQYMPTLIPTAGTATADGLVSPPAPGSTMDPGSSGKLAALAPTTPIVSARTEKIKALVQHGGNFLRNAQGSIEYVGGETRLITLPTLAALKASAQGPFKMLQGQLKGTLGAVSDGTDPFQNVVVRYELPGSRPPLFIDLTRDDDVVNMWEAWEEHQQSVETAGAQGAQPATKLRLCIGPAQAAPVAGAAGAAGGAADVNPCLSDASSVGECSPSSVSTAFAAAGGGKQQADQGQRGGGGGTPVPKGHAGAKPGTPGNAGPSTPDVSTGARSGMQGTRNSSQPSLKDLVTTKPRVALNDLESRLEILKPEDLKILKFIGAGGYGEVYMCRWSNADVAVKCLNPNLLGPHGNSNEAVTDLLKEAMMLGRLRHPNVVWVYGVVLPSHLESVRHAADRLGGDHQIDVIGVSADAVQHAPYMPGMIRPPALVTEYMSGGSVRAALSENVPAVAPAAVRVKLALDAARGMEYLHNRKIVHFDLKAANLLLGWKEGELVCKVADFGLSKQRLQTYVTGVASLRGTLPWTAPEIIRSPHAVNEKVDVFSFGLTLWELWTGKEPWEGLNYHALLHHLSMNQGARPPCPGTPEWEGDALPEPAPGWAEMMRLCWQDDPQKRPAFTELVPQLKVMLAKAQKAAGGVSGASNKPTNMDT